MAKRKTTAKPPAEALTSVVGPQTPPPEPQALQRTGSDGWGDKPKFERDYGLGTGTIPVGDVTPGNAPGSTPAKPPVGEQTYRQATGFAGVGFAQLPGFTQPLPGTYLFYRRMASHPTLALAKSIATAPVLASSWSYEVRRPDGKPTRKGPRTGDGVMTDGVDRELADRSAVVQAMFDPIRSAFLWEALRALEFGWRPFEKIWAVKNGRYVLSRLKPLLPDFTWIYIDRFGNFNGLTQMDAGLGAAKAFIYTYDGEAGNLYGRSRYENVRTAWWNWHQVDDKAAQLATKAAAIIPMIHYPMGRGQDVSGETKSNYDLATQMLNGLQSGKGIALPNLAMQADDARVMAEMAGKSTWVISFLEAANAATNMTGMTDRQRYYDQLMFRGFLRSERTGMEAQTAGSRADSESHADAGITDSALVHSSICEALNTGAVDDVLTLNWGEEARGSVYVTPAPLQDAKRALFTDLFSELWAQPAGMSQFVKNADMDAVFDLMEIPKTSAKVTFEMPDPQQQEPPVKLPKAAVDAKEEAAKTLSLAVQQLIGDEGTEAA